MANRVYESRTRLICFRRENVRFYRTTRGTVYVSAAKGIGVDVLLERIDHLLEDDRPSRVRLKVPQKEGKLLAMLEAKAIIVSRTYREGNVHLEIEAPESVLRGVKEFVK